MLLHTFCDRDGYNQHIMKAKYIFSATILLLGLLTAVLVLINFNPPVALAKNTVTAALQQTTPTPQVADVSEIGSTDGILIMGIVIVLIVTLPLIFNKRK
jgi:hypothetical protein